MNDKVSIISPVYRIPQKALEICIESLINQTYKNIEILLVDDGSPDNCGIICDQYAVKDSRVKVIHKQNGGVSSARNLGIENSTGDYVLFVDADDCLHSNAIEILINEACKKRSDIVICSYKRFYTETPQIEKLPLQINVSNFTKKDELIELRKQCLKESGVLGVRFNGAPWCKLYKKELIDGNHLSFDTSLVRSQDNYFNLQIFGFANVITYVDAKLYYYRFIETSSVNRFRPNLFEISSLYLEKVKQYMINNNLVTTYSSIYEMVCIEKMGEYVTTCAFHKDNKSSFKEKCRNISIAYETWLPEYSKEHIHSLGTFRSKIFMSLLLNKHYYLLYVYDGLLAVLRSFKKHFAK